MTVVPRVFDTTGDIPHGRVAVEASAGTGKTHTLADLATRYVADADVAVGELLVVTFTRAAAAELRSRVRSRLVAAVAALQADEPPRAADDALLALLCTGPAAARQQRLNRLVQAVTDFDTATITTIHGFAQQVLAALGVSAAGDIEATLVGDARDLVAEVATDLLATEAAGHDNPIDLLPSLAELRSAALTVLANPGIELVPGPDPDESDVASALKCRLVHQVINEVDRRRRATGTIGFDDLLTQLRDTIDGGESEAAVAYLRRRFRVALVDEFQDTDPLQWAIFSMLFGDADSRSDLVLVGDPKQAIYAFRGANVHTYLDAVGTPGTASATLGTNWRSDRDLLRALEVLFAGATFGDPRIGFIPVQPAPAHDRPGLRDADGEPFESLELRLALDESIPRGSGGALITDPAEAAIRSDLCDRVATLLTTARVPDDDHASATRPLRPDDVAVLVGSHAEATRILADLRAHEIPAVVTRGDSVLASPAATQWRWLIDALVGPSDPTRARTVALSWFFGWAPERVAATAAGDDLAEVHDRLQRWAGVLLNDGFTELRRHVWADSDVAVRVLACANGDRDLTDLDHVAELLQSASQGRRIGPAGLAALFDQLGAAEDASEPDNDVTARRVESDARAVQVMTIHAAKGLEFAVVCCPTLWRKRYASAEATIFQSPATGRRTFDITNGASWPDAKAGRQRKALANREAIGENLRLLYVAATRARHHAIMWWTRAPGSEITGLARVLFARDGADIDAARFDAPKVSMPDDDGAVESLDPLVARSGGALAVHMIGAASGPVARWHGDQRDTTRDHLRTAPFDRGLVRLRRRWSFTAISSRVHMADVDPFDESLGDAGASDEHIGDQVGEPDDATDLPLGIVAGSADFGTLVHEVLEQVDFTSPDIDAELHSAVTDRLRSSDIEVDPDLLVAGIRASIDTPLGPMLDGIRLRDVGAVDRLDELGFELLLGEAGRVASDADIGRVVLEHIADADPFRPWAEKLRDGLFDTDLAGHLTGSIDLVLRTAGADGTPRFVVVDYKTNLLHEQGMPARQRDYHPDRLPAAMVEHHYPLQALLYSVALHRYLRWRLQGYEPAVHLGGVAYLFLRGMIGPTTALADGRPHGVFAWPVPAQLVTDLSDLLAGSSRPRA